MTTARDVARAHLLAFVHERLTEWGGSEDVMRLMIHCCEFDGLKSGKRNEPPRIGADTNAILRTLDLAEARTAELRAAGVVGN